MEIIHANEKEFKDIVKDKYVLVDFYADWCGPCKMLGPILENIKDEIQVVKVNVDDCEDLAREYGVMSIPNMFLMKNGEVIDSKIGFTSEADLKDWISINK